MRSYVEAFAASIQDNDFVWSEFAPVRKGEVACASAKSGDKAKAIASVARRNLRLRRSVSDMRASLLVTLSARESQHAQIRRAG